MNMNRLSTLLGVALLATALTACKTTEQAVKTADQDLQVGQATQSRLPQAEVLDPPKLSQLESADLGIYSASLSASKRKAGKGSKIKEQSFNVNGRTYYSPGLVIDRKDVKRVFVSKTNSDQPALGLRLTPKGAAKLVQQRRKGYGYTLATYGDAIFAVVNGKHADLTDGVLLLPMVSLDVARDLADRLR